MTGGEDFGPAMSLLNDRQRRFVQAMIERPGITFTQAARLAGYADPGGHNATVRVRAHLLSHNPKVQDAIREEAGKRLQAGSLMAANALLAVLQDRKAETKDKIKAAGMLLDRTGFGAAQTINVHKTVTDRTGLAMADRIKELALVLGIDAAKLLGPNAAPVVIEGEAVRDGG